MAFDYIKPIESSENYLNIAIKKAIRKTKQKKLQGNIRKIDKIKNLELNKLTITRDILCSRLEQVLDQFPKFEDLNQFYKELIHITVGKYELESALNKIRFVTKKITEIYSFCLRKIKSSPDISSINRPKSEFYGRISSLVDSLAKELVFLEKSRKIIQSFPTIKDDMEKIAIAGFPNVGKSTLLSRLSSAKPEIAEYAFTTKKILIGYLEKNGKNVIQLLDTPGTLNRQDKMNLVEKQAHLAMKLVADRIIYIFDLTEPYPLDDQIKLYEHIKKFDKPLMLYLSKTDILDKSKISEFRKRFKESITDVDELKSKLEKIYSASA